MATTNKIARRTKSPVKQITTKSQGSGASSKLKDKSSKSRGGYKATTERQFREAWRSNGGRVKDVAQALHKTTETVHNWRKRFGLVEAALISRRELEDALNAAERDTTAVAGHFNKSVSYINKLMRKYGISNKGQRGVSKRDLTVLLHYVGDLPEISKITGRNIHSLHQDIYRHGLSLKDFKNGQGGPGSLDEPNEINPSKQDLTLTEANEANAGLEPWHSSLFPTPLFPAVSTEALRTFFRVPIMIL